jgi:hypothetical protein
MSFSPPRPHPVPPSGIPSFHQLPGLNEMMVGPSFWPLISLFFFPTPASSPAGFRISESLACCSYPSSPRPSLLPYPAVSTCLVGIWGQAKSFWVSPKPLHPREGPALAYKVHEFKCRNDFLGCAGGQPGATTRGIIPVPCCVEGPWLRAW